MLGSSIVKLKRVFWGMETVSGAYQYRVQTLEMHLNCSSGANVELPHSPGDLPDYKRRAHQPAVVMP